MCLKTFDYCGVLGSWVHRRRLVFLPKTTYDVTGGGRSYRLAEILVRLGHRSVIATFGERNRALLDIADGLCVFHSHERLFLKLFLGVYRVFCFCEAVVVQALSWLFFLVELLGYIGSRSVVLA